MVSSASSILISPRQIQQATANLRTPANQLCFLLSWGYFKAGKRFFPARTFHPRDVEYVVGRTDSVPTAAPSLPKKSHVCCAPKSSPRSSSGAVSMS
jgi:hypothetical protein